MAGKSVALVFVIALASAACSDGDAATSATTSKPTTTTTSSAAPGTTSTTLSTTSATPTAAPPTTATTTLPPASEAGDTLEIVAADLLDYESVEPPSTVLIGVPRLQGLGDAAIQQGVNDSLLDIVTGAEESFLADVARYVETVEPTPEAPASSVEMFYDVRFLTLDLLSIRFETSTYFQGAANPGQTVQTLNIDLTSGDEVHLPDLFLGSEWAFALDTLLRQQITEQVYEGDAAGLDGWVDAEALVISQIVAFSDADLEFSFQEFEIGPGVLGAPTVTLPYNAMGVYIDPDGVLGALVEATGNG